MLNDVATRRPFSMRLLVGGGIVFTALSALSEVAPTLAGSFSLLVTTSAVLAEGEPALSFLMNNANQNQPQTDAQIASHSGKTTPKYHKPTSRRQQHSGPFAVN